MKKPAGLLLRCWQVALVLTLASLFPFYAIMDEPFWCVTVADVLVLLVLPGALAAGWLLLFVLVAARWRERGMRSFGLALLLLAAPSLLVCSGAVAAYLADLAGSPALLCTELPDWGSCAAGRPPGRS